MMVNPFITVGSCTRWNVGETSTGNVVLKSSVAFTVSGENNCIPLLSCIPLHLLINLFNFDRFTSGVGVSSSRLSPLSPSFLKN